MDESKYSSQKRCIYWGLFLIILTTAAIRYPLLEVPLERDEGEYAYAAQLILQGIPPYKSMYSMKLPGIYGIYALILTIFGQTHQGIHLCLLFINAATIIMIFFLVKRLINPIAGISAAASFAFLSLGQSVLGISANSEHFVILFAVSSASLLLNGIKSQKLLLLFFSGICAGFSFLVKQHGVSFIIFGAILILTQIYKNNSISPKNIVYQALFFIVGSVLPYVITLVFFYYLGVFNKFWFWTVEYALSYTDLIPLDIARKNFVRSVVQVLKSSPAIWIVSGTGLIAALVNKKNGLDKHFVLLFFVFSFIAIFPGFYFRPHYFILLLPAASIFFGAGIVALSESIGKTSLFSHKNSFSILLILICLSSTLFIQRTFLFQMSPRQVSRLTYGLNPFPESLEIKDIIQKLSKKEDRIAVLGSEPQIFFYSNRHSATGYVYMYPLMECHDFAKQMQIEMIQEIEKAAPELLIIVNVRASWLQRSDTHKLIFEWLNSYRSKYYRILCLVEIGREKTLYHWIPDIILPPKSSRWMLIMKRIPKKATKKVE